jgi:hypothetical protein
MQEVNVVSDMLSALVRLRDDPELAQRFTEEPEPVLRELGVDLEQVTIQRLPGGNAPYENFKQAVDRLETMERPPIHVCGSVGAGVCASVGTTFAH